MHAQDPHNGVRYEFFLDIHDDARARYRCVVHTAAGAVNALVEIDREGARIVEEDAGIEPAHRAQLVALARAVGKRDESPWPRRVNRWRAPGVR